MSKGWWYQSHGDFNPHTLCRVWLSASTPISNPRRFQSTHPLQGVTTRAAFLYDLWVISIHTPFAGCDPNLLRVQCVLRDFNPHTLCRVWHSYFGDHIAIIDFNPHTLCRVWLTEVDPVDGFPIISIHTPFAGCDQCHWYGGACCGYFNPHTLCRVWPTSALILNNFFPFQSTHPLQGVTV